MYRRNSRIRYSEVDQKGNLTIVGLINYLQDCSAFQAEDLGLGLPYLNAHGYGWYITYWEIKIHALPENGDAVSVSTAPTSFKGMFGHRIFTMEDADGHRLVEADSLWILMDIHAGRPVRLPREMLEKYELAEPLPGAWQGRKIVLWDDFTDHGTVEVSPVHLDTNHHMNNAYYIEIARDALPEGRKIYGIRTEYKKPALLKDVLTVRTAVRKAGAQVVLASAGKDIYAVVEFLTEGQG